MGARFNAVTGQMEDDGVPVALAPPAGAALVRPMTGAPIDTAPDDVQPADLQTPIDPRHPYAGAIPLSGRAVPVGHPAPTPPGQGGQPMTSLVPRPVQDDGSPVKQAKFVEPSPIAGEGGDQGPPAPGAPVPAPPVRHAGGGGGMGQTGGHLTADEAVAEGGVETAREERDAATRAAGGVEEQKATAASKLDDQQRAELAAFTKQRTEARDAALKHLQERSDAAARMPVQEQFEGRPLARVLAALAAGIGAKAAAITGTENTALRVLDEAAKDFRQRQQQKYEREMKGVEDEKERVQFASMQASADEAGLRQRFAMDREANLRQFGAPEARVKTDAILSAQHVADADEKRKTATQLHDRHQKEILTAAQVMEARAQAGHASAETQKTLAEADAIKANGGMGKGDRAAGMKINLGIFGSGVVDALNEANGLGLSEAEKADALRRVQQNETTLKSQEGPKSPGGAWLANKMRDNKLLPQSRTDGLSPKQTQFINKLDVAQKKVATVLAGQGHANAHEMVDVLRPQPGDDPATIRSKLLEMSSFGEAAKAEAGPYATVASEAIRRTKEAGAPAPLSKAQVVEAQAWLNTHRNDPDAPGVEAAIKRARGL